MTARHDGPQVVYYRAYQIAFIAIKNSLSWKYINLFHQGNTTLPMMQCIGGTHGRFLSSPLNGRPEQAKLVKTIHLKQWCPDKNIHNIDEGLPMIFSLLSSQKYIFWCTQHKCLLKDQNIIKVSGITQSWWLFKLKADFKCTFDELRRSCDNFNFIYICFLY